jgi:hypothetical protein
VAFSAFLYQICSALIVTSRRPRLREKGLKWAMAQTEGPRRRSGQATGMQGVYLAAAELTKRGLTVSPTSRSSFGADLLVTDEGGRKAWSVQVKSNFGRPRFWLLNKHSDKVASPSHVFVLVNLNQANSRQRLLRPEFYVVPAGSSRSECVPRPGKQELFFTGSGLATLKGIENGGAFLENECFN